jgi:hypothetical protein
MSRYICVSERRSHVGASLRDAMDGAGLTAYTVNIGYSLNCPIIKTQPALRPSARHS